MSKTIEPQSARESTLSDPARSNCLAGQAATLDEARLIRRLQMMMNMVMQVIAQDASLTVEDASQMIADARPAALAMFPAKNWPTISFGVRAFSDSCVSASA